MKSRKFYNVSCLLYITFNYNYVYIVFTSIIHNCKLIFFSNIDTLSDIAYIYMYFYTCYKLKLIMYLTHTLLLIKIIYGVNACINF